MGLNIKNERVHQLAQEAARRTGMTQTSAIEKALSRLLDELDRTADSASRPADVRRLLEDIDTRLSDDERRRMITESLYDEHGLPA